MSSSHWLTSIGLAACLVSLPVSPAAAQNPLVQPLAPPQVPYSQLNLPIGYRLALPSHFVRVKNPNDGQNTWRFQGKTMQVVITAWQAPGWTAKQITYQSYQNWISLQNKQLSKEIDLTPYYGPNTNANWHYIQGTGIYNQALRHFGIAGIQNVSTQVCVSIRFDWPNLSDNTPYLDTANKILASLEISH